MARSRRFIFRGCQGIRRQNVNWDAIESVETVVLITAAQWRFFGGVFGSAGRPFLGDPGQEPKVYITNIGPHGSDQEAGGVEFLIHAESPHPIDVMVDLTVLGPPEQVDVIG
ncbi:MAG: hypothetical protein HOY78_40960 [Saccharothrix sp.]|nr:hypothetical protein [Saccharothrix sp.]